MNASPTRPSNVTNALRKLYHAREQLRHKCQELGLKLVRAPCWQDP